MRNQVPEAEDWPLAFNSYENDSIRVSIDSMMLFEVTTKKFTSINATGEPARREKNITRNRGEYIINIIVNTLFSPR